MLRIRCVRSNACECLSMACTLLSSRISDRCRWTFVFFEFFPFDCSVFVVYELHCRHHMIAQYVAHTVFYIVVKAVVSIDHNVYSLNIAETQNADMNCC